MGNDLAMQTLTVAMTKARIESLRRGEMLAVIGLDRNDLADVLRDNRIAARGVFLLEADDASSTQAILSRLLDDLATLALGLWPNWFGTNLEAENSQTIAARDPAMSELWLRAATKRAAAGKAPRFRRMPQALEFEHLMRAIDPSDLVLVASPDPASVSRAGIVIDALEWCAQRGATIVAAFATSPPCVPPFDRILYGAVEVLHKSEPPEARFIAANGRAHPGSVIEKRLEAALQRDEQLRTLFSCNETIAIVGYGSPRVDFLWREGRVVVEIDGPEHQRDPNFENDRHRDYELLIAGYTVLRLTNNQVVTDLTRAIEKIRDVVDLSRSTGKMVRS